MRARLATVLAALALVPLGLPFERAHAAEKTAVLPGTGRVAVGDKAPPISSWDTADSLVRLAELLEAPDTRAVLVSFYTSWCKECPTGLTMLQENSDRLKKAGILLLLINHGEDAETIAAHRESKGIALRTVSDEFRRIGTAYGVRFVPISFLVVRDGTVRQIYTHEGKDFVDRILEDAAAGSKE